MAVCGMSQSNTMNHDNTYRLTLGSREIILIGTAHVSRSRAELVENVILEESPDVVCVELCKARFDAIMQKDKWSQTDIVKVIRDKQTSLLVFQLLMLSFQKKIAQKLSINPGEEMIQAISRAEEIGAEVVLADRDVRVTLLRAWRMMSFWSKITVIPEMIFSLFSPGDITEEEIEKLKKHDALEMVLQTVSEKLPVLKAVLIDERDQYLAHTIGHAPGRKIVAVVGAGHIPGIMKNLGKDIDVKVINQIPPPGLWSKFTGWMLSVAVIVLFIAGFFYSGSQASMNMIKSWTVITATCSAAGALILLAHPVTIAASAVAAPITSLHPLIAAGWVAGLTEATIRKPQVKDFLELTNDITTIRGFFRNKISRVLLLVVFVNLTTSIGTFVAIPVMMRYF